MKGWKQMSRIIDDIWDEEIIDDLSPMHNLSIVVYSRDWTIETINNQISQNNINLYPKFQRRNAWSDEKRSLLIESLILGLPVPEIVLAEDPEKRKSFIVIDGKQRLLTIAGFLDPINTPYWKNNGKLIKLKVRKDLNNHTYSQIENDIRFQDDKRQLLNADIRCTVISNYKNTDLLYNIFYRLNTGSVPLSTQELRQVLNKGNFADYLIDITERKLPLHEVMNLEGPDPRLSDIEIILRFFSFCTFGRKYNGNLKYFLDNSMEEITKKWTKYEVYLDGLFDEFNKSTIKLINTFGSGNVGRKIMNGAFESKFNRALFEVQVYYFMFIPTDILTPDNILKINNGFKTLFSNHDFKDSIESTTKSLSKYKARFTLFREFINNTLGMEIHELPINISDQKE